MPVLGTTALDIGPDGCVVPVVTASILLGVNDLTSLDQLARKRPT